MSHWITEIRIEQLFGRYDYRIRLGGDSDDEMPQMSLLYGDNGTGKTTILNLVFHLLSSDPDRGHKSSIAQMPFRDLSVVFSDGTKIFASRQPEELIGAFEFGWDPTEGSPGHVTLSVDPETGNLARDGAAHELEPLLKKISSFVPAVYYLGDDRTLKGDALPVHLSRAHRRRRRRLYDEDLFHESDGGHIEYRKEVLRESIDRTQHQLYVELARASTQGEADARQIYAEILNSIARARQATAPQVDETVTLEEDLKQLERTSNQFAAYHLGPAIAPAPLLESLSNADDITRPMVSQVLRSYINGQKARLDALRNLYMKMHNFVSITNDYLTDKQVDLDIPKGITIRTPGGTIDPTVLSSGEQHLLLLFLNMFTSSDQLRLFIIDEPELSLNIKWQRQLVTSLLELTNTSQCQFLLATHSLELLSNHTEYVVKLGK